MRVLKITNMFEMSEVLDTNLNIVDETTILEDVDDDFGQNSLDIKSAITPELPHRDFNIATLTPEKLDELRRGS